MPDGTPGQREAPRRARSGADVEGRMRELELAFETGLGTPFTDGNRVEPLRNGVRIFPAMLEAISQARTSIDLLTFIYWKGAIARRFAEALAAKACEGVRVRVLLDALGSMPMPRDLLRLMEDGGVQVRRFRPLTRWKIWRHGHRTHRKALVCDDRVGFTGGVGIAEEWEGDARDPSEWRDTHFRVLGPAVRGLKAAFLEHWLESGARTDAAELKVGELEPAGPVRAQVVRSRGQGDWSDVLTATQILVTSPRRRLRLATAYFVPERRTVDALCEVARDGVEVDLLIPGPHNDHRMCRLAGQETFGPMLECGIRIWEYLPTMMHVKLATVDGVLAFVGSPNLNQRSMRRDDELALTLLDPALASELERQFDADLERARPIDLAAHKRRGPLARTKETLAQLLRPQL